MFRQLVLIALVTVALVGCGKKKADGSSGGSVETSGDPNAEYSIKIRDEEKGDKVQVVKSRSGTQTKTAGGKSLTQKEGERLEFTQTILELPADAPKPTKLTRAYKLAQRTDARGELKPLSYSDKTVTIEKKGKSYTFAADGKPLPSSELAEFRNEFEKSEKTKFSDLLPSKPVKIGEAWTVDFSKIKALMGELVFNLDKEKSNITGTLRRVYSKDGQQWGAIELNIRMVIAPASKGPPLSGTITATITYDTAIDGSVHAGTMKTIMNGTVTATDPKTGEIKVVIDGTQELTGTPVK